MEFKHKNEKILHNLNIDLKKGESVAIVGPSGSGKSTIIDLILRLYDPDSGSIKVDYVDIKIIK